MNRMLSFAIHFIFLMSSFYCISADTIRSGSNSELEKFEWLLGTWESKSSRGSIYETWSRKNSSEFYGRSYALKGLDTVIFETVRLVGKDGEVLYIPSVSDQNNGNPVVFTASFISQSKFIVENPDHDFPKIISYTRIAKDQLVAEISGPSKDGSYKYQTFAMHRYPDEELNNIELVKSVFRYFNEHNWQKMSNCYADPCEFKDPAFGIDVVIQSRLQIINKYEEMNRRYPDINDEIVQIYPSGENRVIVEFMSSGTSLNGSKWSLPIVTLFTIENNLIVKDFTYYDQ